jgi:hypothetical protein
VGCALVLFGETNVNHTRFGIASSLGLVLALSSTTVFAQTAPTIGGPTAAPPAADATASTGANAPTTTAPDSAAPSTTDGKEAAPEPLIWRGTTFTWTHTLSTTTVGVGRDNIGHEDEYYQWDFVLAPNLYVLDLKDDKINIFAEAGVSVEWTDAGDTTTKHEPRLRDTQVGAGYTRNIFTSEDKEWSTKAGIKVRGILPTSKTSINQGRYFTVSVGATVAQVIRLLGNDADGLNNLTVTGGLTYSHLFSRAYTPTNGGLERTRQNSFGQSETSDQLSFSSFDIDRVIPGVTLSLPLYKDLTLATQFRLIGRFKHQLAGDGCDVSQPGIGGCVSADEVESPVTYVTNSTFDVSLAIPIYEIFDLDIGYNNETLTLGADGKNRNVFYSPDAVFYLDLVANIDVMYSKASGREKFELPPTPAERARTADNGPGTGMPSF